MNDKSIHCLPDEIIIMVLKLNNINEILNFGLTCKRFNELINNNESLWKEKFKTLLPVICKAAEQHCNGLWLQELKDFMKQQKIVYEELLKLSPKFYWKTEDVSMHDVENFFTIASNHSLSFYYTIYILQDLITKVNENTRKFYSKEPFTLTEMNNAEIVLRHLIHCYLCVKWIKYESENILAPVNVVNFFLQWTDTHNQHFMEDVEEKLQEVADMVKVYLLETYPLQLQTHKYYTAEQVFHGISHIFFNVNSISLTPKTNLDLVDIIKVWNCKFGNEIVVLAMYQAVARYMGVPCELIARTNNLFLKWKCNEDNQVFKVNIGTGKLEVLRCPMDRLDKKPCYKYKPKSMLQCLHFASFNCPGTSMRWAVINLSDLTGFLGDSYCHLSTYDNFNIFLHQNVDLIKEGSDFNIKYLTDKELQIIMSLLRSHSMAPKPLVPTRNASRVLEVKKHHPSVLYAVGMICCHKRHDYVCLVVGWDRTYNRASRTGNTREHRLKHGHDQPFYKVMAADRSVRYVAQENLIPLANPKRLEILEEFVAKEFRYFDGFCYVLNDEKTLEYPDENPIIEVFRRRYRKYV